MRYALIKISENSIDRFATDVDPTVLTKKDFKWVPCPYVEKPDYIQNVETVEGPSYEVKDSSVVEVWTKRPLKPEEILTEKNVIDVSNGKLILSVINELKETKSKLNEMLQVTDTFQDIPKYSEDQTSLITEVELNSIAKSLES